MQKVTGVSSVRVSLNEGLTVLEFTPGNTVTLGRLRDVIRNNGFVTREATVIASGTIVTSGNGIAFEIAGSRERLEVMASTDQQRHSVDELRARSKVAPPSSVVLITGSVDIADPKAMKLSISAVGQP